MNKKELVARIAQSTGLPQAQVARALDSTIALIKEELAQPHKPPRALDSTINLIPEEVIFAEGNKPKALDSTINLIRPGQKPPKKGRALDSTIHLVPDELVDAGKVKIPGLGTFYTTARKARIGRNPRTGAAVKIKARIVPKFKFSQTLIDRINH